MIIKLKNEPVLIASDAHCKYQKLDELKNKYPEIKTRFFLGDFFSFTNEQNIVTYTEDNKGAGEWLKKNINDWNFVLGNHCLTVCREWWKYGLDQEVFNLVSSKFKISYDLELNNKKYLLLHSKPKSLWDFINAGYQYREFEEDFPKHNDYNAIIGGHTHKEYIHNFIDCDCVIWQVGDIRRSRYAILKDGKITFKRL